MPFRIALIVALLSLPAAGEPLVLEGELADDGQEFVVLPFEVPEGIVELEVRHDDLSTANTLDWGLEDPHQSRGWGGGNPEAAIVGEHAASRSYLAGPLPAGTWKIVIGKAQIRELPIRYRVELDLRNSPTLAPQPERRAYAHAAPLTTGRRWYAGDFHVHSLESGDARPPLDSVASFARSRGLDFVALSEHNTRSHVDFLSAVQERHPELLLVPSVEFTTYGGHANAFGATEYVDHRLGLNGRTLGQAIDDYAAQNAIFTINHPTLDIGSGCIGCAWEHPIPRSGVHAVEIGVGGWETTGALFSEPAIAYWDRLSDEGLHLAALGGSDDHRAGVNLSQTQSPIGDPTTLVFADALSVPALIEAIRQGRTVVKLRGPDDPMIVLEASGERREDTIVGEGSRLRAEVLGGDGFDVRWVHDGVPEAATRITGSPFVLEREVGAPEEGQTRWRVEVLAEGRPRTVTSHVWLSRTWPAEGRVNKPPPKGASCSLLPGHAGALLLAAAAFLLLARRRGSMRR